ncbi:beta-galactosidase [Parvularcula maris]|uniref:Beta-galactosidase n=1 Tax=Parvularcula maris TaxID=2965077 RepID=A0A9X2LAM1_9PROT|nr:beta-galactosidase [Parvularcula maris]MCQ8186056.1 beta-galactosidase [Parvularcula maris]
MSLGVCYYPEHWPEEKWESDAERMKALGLSFARIGEFSWALLEPEPGRYEFGWLDKAVGTLHAAGLEVMLGTPTATPPKWLVDAHDDMLAWDEEGRPRGFGSRRHYCFSSETYRRHSRRITEVLARRYGQHPAVTMWQTDNEFGCHDTVRSYSPMARLAFRDWLREKYTDIDALNEAWGNRFWSMLYHSFDEIELPHLTVTEPNPSHTLDFYRFSSDQVIDFHKEQAEIIRLHAPHATITHNVMGHYYHYDHHELGRHVDVLTWDSYPLGFLAWSRSSDEHKQRYLRQGDPDFAGYHHDLYRGCSAFGVIEQQPGPVNWAPYNPCPLPGMVRLWTVEAFAHGAHFSAPFRWRQVPFAQEQNHAGLLRPDDQPAQGYGEIEEAAGVLAKLGPEEEAARVAILFSYDSFWMAEIQPQGNAYHTEDIVSDWYAAARSLGLDVDIVHPSVELSRYDVVLIPSLLPLTEEVAWRLEESGAALIAGARSGSKNENGNIIPGLAPGPLKRLLPLTVTRSETIPPGPGGKAGAGHWHIWRDEVECDAEPALTDEAGRAVLYRFGEHRYFAALPDRALLREELRALCAARGIETADLPEGLRLRSGRGHRFAFNYGPEPVELPAGLGPSDGEFLTGGRTLPPAGIAAWRLP